MLNNLIGKYSRESLPFWMGVALHIPFLRKKFKSRSVSEIQVYEDGIVLLEHGDLERRKEYKLEDIRRIWFETFTSGNDEEGNTSFRIDVIANNLDVLFSMKETNCSASNENLLLMKRLYDLWEKDMMQKYELLIWLNDVICATNIALTIED